MRIAVLILALALADCSGGSLVSAQRSCTDSNPQYLPMWDCIKGRAAQGTAGSMNNDLGLRYMAQDDALAEHVRAGRMTDAQAKAALGEELVRGSSEFERRKAANADGGPLVCTRSATTTICN